MAPAAGKCGGRGFSLKKSLKRVCPCRCFNTGSTPRPKAADQNSPPPPSLLNPAAASQLRAITVDELGVILEYIDAQLKRLDPDPAESIKASSSLDLIVERLAPQCQQQKEIASSIVQSLPGAFTKEIVGDAQAILMPLLKNALGGLGTVHWVGLGLSLIAWSIDNINVTSQNRKDFLDVLKQVVFLLSNTRNLLQQEEIHDDNHRIQAVQENVKDALECVIICSSSLRDDYLWRFLKASSEKEAIAKLQDKLSKARSVNTAVEIEIIINNMPKPPRQAIFRLEDNKIEETVQRVMTILEAKSDRVLGLGLHGMGGIGKSTLGLKIFQKFQEMQHISYNCCRVALARDISNSGLPKIQKQIMEKVCKRSISEFSDVVEGKTRMREELFQSGPAPIFLYIDNVMHPEHLIDLLPESMYFPPGSIILITTRNEGVVHKFRDLKIVDYWCEEVKKLNPKEAKELFWQQFEVQGISTSNERSCEAFQQLEEAVLHHCDGLPLALTLVGSYIASNEGNGVDLLELWSEVIKSMEGAEPLEGEEKDPLYARLKHVSIDQLHPRFKRSFVDVVVYGEDLGWEGVERLVGKIHLEELRRRALVQKGLDFNMVNVHDVIRSIGVQMAREDKGELRVKGDDEFRRNNGSLENVVGLSEVCVHEAQMFQRMTRLRVLIDVTVEGECETAELKELVVVRGLECNDTSASLHIGGCSKLKELWASSCIFDLQVLQDAKHLEVLAIFGGEEATALQKLEVIGCLTELKILQVGQAGEYLKELPVGMIGALARLELLSLYCCTSLRCLPQEIEHCTGLTSLQLEGCTSLRCLPQEIERCTGLTFLQLKGCTSLQSLPHGIFTSCTRFTTLDLCGCLSLVSLPHDIGSLTSLTKLNLKGCESLTSLPEGIGSLTGLTELYLNCCESLHSLPEGIGSLTGLIELDLRKCDSLNSLPDGIFGLTGLTELCLGRCRRLTSLPAGISRLTGLTELDLEECESLHSLPEEIGSLTGLTNLDLRGCESLHSLPEGIASLTGLTKLILGRCRRLTSLPAGISRLTGLTGLYLEECESLHSLPEGIRSLTGLTELLRWQGWDECERVCERVYPLSGGEFEFETLDSLAI